MAISIAFLTACTSNYDTIEEENSIIRTVRMTLNVNKQNFDALPTRVVSTDWKKEDIIYLRFHTSNGIVIGNAKCNGGTDWTVNYYGTLERNSEMQVEVTFFDDASLTMSTDGIVTLTENVASYQDIEGTYIYYSNGELFINATLKPLTSRIRFKGTPKEAILVGGMKTYKSYDVNNGMFTTSDSFISTAVNASGTSLAYTNYIYGVLSDNVNPQLKINKQEGNGWDYLYTANCTDNMVMIGKSGWMNIPTHANRNGWTMKQVSGEENGHLWVDLGLPSGTKWADENVGADLAQWQEDGKINNIYGDWYSWGSIDKKNYVLNEQATINIGTQDAARVEWGGRWQIPSEKDIQELIDNCVSIWVDNYYPEVNGLIVIGESGMEIFFPAAGYWNRFTESNGGYCTSTGQYWTSTAKLSVSENAAASYSLNKNLGVIFLSRDTYKIHRFSVRAVIK